MVHRGSPKLDEDGNVTPLPEIPTSIDPQEGPDYSSWGEKAASVNYIGLITYLVKTNTELHEVIKTIQSNISQTTHILLHCLLNIYMPEITIGEPS